MSKKAKVSAASRKVARAAAKQVGSQFHGHLREEATFCMGNRAYLESVVAMAPCEAQSLGKLLTHCSCICVRCHQALTWADADDSGLAKSKALRIVVVKDVFHPQQCQVSPCIRFYGLG